MNWLIKRWQLTSARAASGILAFLFVSFFLVFRLVSRTRLLAQPVEQQSMLHGWHAIWHDPLNAPYFIFLRLVRYYNHTLFDARAVSAVLGIGLCLLFYYVVRKWLNYRLATISVIWFGTNGYFLHASRLSAPLMLQMFVSLGLVALWTAAHRNTAPWLRWLWAGTLPVLLYVPGAVWLVAAALLVGRRRWLEAWRRQRASHKVLLCLFSAALLAPLGYHLVVRTLQTHSAAAFRAWAGITEHSLQSFGKTFALTPVHLFVHGDGSGVTTFPALSVAVTVLTLLGILIAFQRRQDGRWRYALTVLAAGWVAVGLGGMGLIVIVPVLYLLATVGLAYLLSEWYRVFPRNPIARGFGFLMISSVVALSSLYGLRLYFVAGPHTQAAARSFVCPSRPPRPPICPRGTL
jgi:hypothetical protein